MASYQRLPSGNWRALFYVNGQRRSLTRPTRRECVKAVEVFEYATNSGLTVGQAVDEYITTHTNTLSPSTVASFRTQQKHHFLDLQRLRVSAVTPTEINRAINAEASQYAPKTVRNAYGLIRTALLPYLPIKSWDIRLPQKAKKEIRIPSEQEVKTLLDRSSVSDVHTCLQLAAFCGLRRSEISALTYADVQNGYININKAMVRDENNIWRIKKPKSYAGYRKIKLPSVIDLGHGKPSEHITTLTPSQITDRCLYFSNGTISPHQLRHYYASVLLKLGVPNKYAARQMGHAGEQMLQQVYQHLFPDAEAEFDNRVADLVSKL